MNLVPPRSLWSLLPGGAGPAPGRPGDRPAVALRQRLAPKATVERPAEHEFEAEHGLPEPLPAGERLLWQGAPHFPTLARRAFHLSALAVYFGVILALRAATVLGQGGSAADAAVAVLWLLPAALAVLALVATLAWLTARTTAYTVTDKRVVMRIGIVLSVTFNLPYPRLAAAAVSAAPGGAGDIALTLEGPDRIAWMQLWPHVRPWRVKRPQPSLRCIADAQGVGRTISEAWRAARGLPVAAAAAAPFMHAARRIDPAAEAA